MKTEMKTDCESMKGTELLENKSECYELLSITLNKDRLEEGLVYLGEYIEYSYEYFHKNRPKF